MVELKEASYSLPSSTLFIYFKNKKLGQW